MLDLAERERPSQVELGLDVVRAFVGVADAMGEDVELDVLLHYIARRITALVGIPRCSVYLLDEKTGTFVGRIGEPETGGDADIRRLRSGTSADAFTREIVETKEPVIIQDAHHDPRPVRSAMRHWGIRSMLGVPLILRKRVIGILYLDNPGEVRSFTPETLQTASAFANLAALAIDQSARSGEMKATLEALERKNDMLFRSAVIDERLTRLLAGSCGLNDIAVAVSQLSGKPCVIWDAERRPLAVEWPGDGAPTKVVFDGRLSACPDLKAALSVLQPGRPGLIGPYLPTLPNRLLAAQICVRDETWGYIALSESDRRFTPIDAATVRRAAMVVVVELTAERRAMRGLADARQMLMRNLLRGIGPGEPHFDSRAEVLDLHSRRAHVVCLLRSRSPGTVLSRSEIATALGPSGLKWFPEMTVSDDGTVALLVEVTEGQSAEAAVTATKAALDPVIDALCGENSDTLVAMSSVAGSAVLVGRAYDEALQVLGCLERLTCVLPGPLALAADDLGPARLLLGAADFEQASRYASEVLEGLFDGDQRPTDLLTTLNAYFARQRNIKTTAAAMDVHENTVRYRLARVAEITGLQAMTDPDDQVQIHVALTILRLTGRLPAPMGASGQSHFIPLR